MHKIKLLFLFVYFYVKVSTHMYFNVIYLFKKRNEKIVFDLKL